MPQWSCFLSMLFQLQPTQKLDLMRFYSLDSNVIYVATLLEPHQNLKLCLESSEPGMIAEEPGCVMIKNALRAQCTMHMLPSARNYFSSTI
jgi:hypothetical protein